MTKLKVLLVDDASFIRDLLKKSLRDQFPHFILEEAANGRKAQQMLQREEFNLILCDWEMPELSGLELLTWLRKEHSKPDTPFIMVTSRGDRDNVMQAVQAGVNEYIGKPFSSNDLIKKVVKVMSKFHSADELRGKVQALSGADALMGSANNLTAARPKPSAKPSAAEGSAGALMATSSKAAPNKPAAAKAKAPPTEAKASDLGTAAQIRFPNLVLDCIVQNISLKDARVIIKREQGIPELFSQAVIDLEQGQEKEVARINAFVQSMQAGEKRMDSSVIKLTIQFVDDDPQKLEYLSKLIAQGTGKKYF